MKKWNKEFDVEDIGTNCFYIVLVDDNCADNFSDCINQEGKLIYTNNQRISQECELAYVTNRNTESIVLNADCTFEFDGVTYPESFKFKGAFLTTDSGFIMGYSINLYSLEITTELTFEKDLVFYDIVEGVSNGGQ